MRNLKRKLTSYVLIAGLSLSLSFSPAGNLPGTTAQAKAVKVYCVPDGYAYHSTKNCRTLSRSHSIYKTTKKKAKREGRSACKVCY